MKFMYALIIFLYYNEGFTQNTTGDKIALTSTLPQGTVLKDGKILIMPGYKAVYSMDQKMVHIQRISTARTISANSISGSFKCKCDDSKANNDCQIQIKSDRVNCVGTDCKDCAVNVTIDSKSAIAGYENNVLWKKFIFPSKAVRTQ
jgi:hypothetical protein